MDAANYMGVGIQGNIGSQAFGTAKTVTCPRCGSAAGRKCFEHLPNSRGYHEVPNHVERGRVARYSVMGIPPITAEEREA